MKKKNILLLAFAMFASFGLASCDEDTPINVSEHSRGEVDNSSSNIILPDVDFEEDPNVNPNPQVDPNKPNYDEYDDVVTTTDTISTDNSGFIEVDAGSASIDVTDGGKFLYASPNIGYKFLGWYLGDECLSTESYFKVDKDAEKIAAKFELEDGFKDL